MHSQSNTQKNQKTGLPPMKLHLLDMDEVTKHESSRNVGYPAMTWPFSKLVTGKSGLGKTNLLGNLVLSDKDEYVQRGEEGGSHYIKCDDLIVCGYHPDESKWGYVRYIYNMISKDPKAHFYEDISFRYIPPERIPSTRAFLPERNTLIIFEDLCLAPEHIQNQISQFFGNGRHQNISIMYNGDGSQQDVSKIADRYTDDVKNASMIINSYLRRGEFIVFDLTRPGNDSLAIRLRFDTPLNLQKEIKARQKRKEKSASANE
ncbi:hypothetical protein RhiirA4_487421 [Rhizophagus irregularis]|uniref:Uncharacterized protein n=1 Tax=Rhizophagus irregularis TaxID=588596 RepID=A0A2I1HSL0_9GLOM|nr:hypothetical protein RhiirA4_487421 [Rhizophagus irregularis]